MKIPIVDEQDRIINETVGDYIDHDIEGIYRGAGVWILSETGAEVLLSMRSKKRLRNPGLWGPAVLGVVEEDDSYEASARKHASTDLGLELGELIEVPKIFIQTDRKYFVQFFIAVLSRGWSEFMLNKEHVDQVRWFSKIELEDVLVTTPEIFIPVLRETYDALKAY